jgi:ATP-dependent RNA helicase DHX29
MKSLEIESEGGFVKKWILDNCNQLSESEKEEENNENNQNLLLEYKQAMMAAKTSQSNEEKLKLGKIVAELKKKMDLTQINYSDLKFDKLNTDLIKNNDCDLESLEDDFNIFLAPNENNIEKNTLSTKIIYNMDCSWSGCRPSELLEEFVSKKYNGAKIKYNIVRNDPGYGAILSLSLQSNLVDKFRISDNEVLSSKKDAKDFVATIALFNLAKDFHVESRLPPPFLLKWSELKEKTDLPKNNLISRRRSFINGILSNSKQDFTIQKQQALNITKSIYKNRKKVLPHIDDFLRRCNNNDYKLLLSTRKNLPVFKNSDLIVEKINQHQVVILSGETGSGKSTQVPQFLLEDAIKRNQYFNLVCTQPRRISAISLSNRVSQELGDSNSNRWVGYQVRNDSNVSKSTLITYSTIGVLLRQMSQDKELSNITHIIIDEVHERSMESDFLLFLLKDLLKKRIDLKVILMSATADANLFSEYFSSDNIVAPCITVPGKTYPVNTKFLEEIFQETGYHLDESSEYSKKPLYTTRGYFFLI